MNIQDFRDRAHECDALARTADSSLSEQWKVIAMQWRLLAGAPQPQVLDLPEPAALDSDAQRIASTRRTEPRTTPSS